MILVTSLLGVSQTIDSVALGAFAKQYRAGSAASPTSALAAAVAAKQIMINDVPMSSDILAAATTLNKNDSGKTFFLDLAAGFAVTLPAVEPGLEFDFIVKTAPTGTYTVVSNASANIVKGSVTSANLAAAGSADIETAGGDTISFVAAKAVAGDRVSMTCDGTSWHMTGMSSVFDAITITTAS